MNFIFAAFVALNALALVSSSPLIINKNKQMRVDLFEGDIAEIDIEQVKVKKFFSTLHSLLELGLNFNFFQQKGLAQLTDNMNERWTNGIVPYTVESYYSKYQFCEIL